MFTQLLEDSDVSSEREKVMNEQGRDYDDNAVVIRNLTKARTTLIIHIMCCMYALVQNWQA